MASPQEEVDFKDNTVLSESSVSSHIHKQKLSAKSSNEQVLHKVQFAAPHGEDDDDGDDEDAIDDDTVAKAANSATPLLPVNNNNIEEERSPVRSTRSSRKRRRTLSEASYFSAVSTGSVGSASTTSSSSSGSSSFTYYSAPDGGWGWVIVMASFLVNMIADGVTFSFGVLFVEFQDEFGESKAVTAGIISLFHAVPLLSGPVASALTDRYGCRKMTILGSLLATAGFLLSSVSYSIEMLYITFGLLSGFGLSLCYVAALVIVAYYFDRRRSFATGISVCGSGVGTFLFAPLTQYLVETYDGWRGACVILAGLFLNMCVCGALFRDLEVGKKRKRKQKKASVSDVSSNGRVSVGAMPEIEELRRVLERGDITVLFSQEELNDCPRLSSSLVTLPTYIDDHSASKSKEPLPEDVIHALSRNKKARHLIVQLYPDSQLAHCLDGVTTDEVEQNETKEIGLKRKVSSLFKKKPVRSILKKPRDNIEALEDNSPSLGVKTLSQQTHQHPKSMYLNHLRIRRQSLTYRGAMLNINRYKLRASSCPDIYRNSMSTIAMEEESESGILSKLSAISCCCGWHNFINASYVFFCVSNFILYAWYDVMYVYLVDYTEKDLRYSSQDATFLLSIIGILNTFGEVIIGWLGDQKWNNINLLYALCMFACGAATTIVPFMTGYSVLGTLAGIFGFAISANYSLTSPILVELVSIEQFSNAYGLLLLVQGISNLVGPPFAGYLYDLTREWYYTFVLSGVCIVLSGLLLLIIPFVKRMSNLLEKRNCDAQDLAENEKGDKIVDTSVKIDMTESGANLRKTSNPVDIQTQVEV